MVEEPGRRVKVPVGWLNRPRLLIIMILILDQGLKHVLRDGLAGVADELQNKVCQGCYISVPPNIYVRIARATEIVQCPSCDRILYLELGD